MTIEGVLLGTIQILVMVNWVVVFILGRAAIRKPRIQALTTFFVLTVLIALGLSVYVWAVANSALGFPISREAAQAVFRAVLVGLALFPLWFLWLYRTGRFRDGEIDG